MISSVNDHDAYDIQTHIYIYCKSCKLKTKFVHIYCKKTNNFCSWWHQKTKLFHFYFYWLKTRKLQEIEYVSTCLKFWGFKNILWHKPGPFYQNNSCQFVPKVHLPCRWSEMLPLCYTHIFSKTGSQHDTATFLPKSV